MHSKVHKLDIYKQGGKVSNVSDVLKRPGASSDLLRGVLVNKDDVAFQVAIKRIRCSLEYDSHFEKIFTDELLLWSQMDHDNVVRLRGFTIEHGYPSFVYDWSEGGTVSEYIAEHPECEKLKIIYSIAEGLTYLHEQHVVHGDLKGDHVLMSRDGTPKLINFGGNRASAHAQLYIEAPLLDNDSRGSPRWAAYELLSFLEDDDENAEIACTEASDIWSFGMVIYEIISGLVPYAEITGPCASFSVIRAIRRRVLPTEPTIVDDPKADLLWKICNRCWSISPVERIPISDIKELLLGSLQLDNNFSCRVLRSDTRRKNSWKEFLACF